MQLIMLETGSEYIFEQISLMGSKINRSDEPSGNDHSWRFGFGRVFAGCFCSPKADCGMIMSVKPGWVGKPKRSVEAQNISGLKTTKSPVSGWNHKRVQSNLAETLIPPQAVLFWIFFHYFIKVLPFLTVRLPVFCFFSKDLNYYGIL